MRAIPALVAIAAVTLVVSACTILGPAPAAWGDTVVTPPPAAFESRPPGVQNADFTITLTPISPRGAAVGVAYKYDMPHCGLMGEIDVDGSYWDAPPDNADPVFDMAPGTFTLLDANTAVFRKADDGLEVRLVRHDGAKAFPLCM